MRIHRILRPLHRRSLAALKVFLLTHQTVLMLFTVGYPLACLGPGSRTLDVSGRVIDPETGQPIARAKVVIGAWDLQLPWYDRNPRKFLVFTDKDGRFQLRREFIFRISRVGFQASAPDNRYGSGSCTSDIDISFSYQRPTQGGINNYFFFPGKGHFEIEVFELPARLQGLKGLQYPTFDGGYGLEPQYVPSE